MFLQEPVNQVVGEGKSLVNKLCADLEPWQIVLYTGSATASVILLKQFLFHDDESKYMIKVKTIFFIILSSFLFPPHFFTFLLF